MRALEIIWTVTKHFLLFWLFPSLRGRTCGERLRRTLEELGLTFIKGGQIMATAQLFKGEALQQLERLYDATNPLSFEVVREIVESELGTTIGEYFSHFDETPLASASIAQTHRATLRDGRMTVVKVRRPGVDKKVIQDLALFQIAITVLSWISQWVKSFRSANVPSHLKKWLLEETDFTVEARNMGVFAEAYKGTRVVIADVYFVTPALLIQEYLPGIPLNRWRDEFETATLSARRSIMAFLEEMFGPIFGEERSLPFSADPHLANLIVMEDGYVGVIDLGLVGKAEPETLRLINSIIFAVSAGHVKATVEGMLILCDSDLPEHQMREFTRRIKRYVKVAPSRPFAYWLTEMVKMLVEQGLPLPEIINLVGRFGVITDGVIQRFFPGISTEELLGDQMRAGIKRRFQEAFDPRHLPQKMYPLMLALANMMETLPRQAAGVVSDPVEGLTDFIEELGGAWHGRAA